MPFGLLFDQYKLESFFASQQFLSSSRISVKYFDTQNYFSSENLWQHHMLTIKLGILDRRKINTCTCMCSFVSHHSNLCGWLTPPHLRWPIFLYITINVFIYTSGQSDQSQSNIQTVERWDASFMLQGRAARARETNSPGGCKINIVCFQGAYLSYLCLHACIATVVLWDWSIELLMQQWM